MTKVKYPDEGAYKILSLYGSSIKNDINSIINTTFVKPAGIDDEVLNTISSIGQNYNTKFVKLENECERADKNYNNLDKQIDRIFSFLEEPIIVERISKL